MNAGIVPLAGQPASPQVPGAGARMASSWASSVSAAVAHGWLRGPLAALDPRQPAPVGDRAAVHGGTVVPAALAQAPFGVFAAPEGSVLQASALGGTGLGDMAVRSQPVPDHGHARGAAARAVAAHAAGSTEAGDGSHDEAAPVRLAARSMPPSGPQDARGVRVHVERHADGAHVWLGIPASLADAGAAAVAAWLQLHREGWMTVARVVTNGRTRVDLPAPPTIDLEENDG